MPTRSALLSLLTICLLSAPALAAGGEGELAASSQPASGMESAWFSYRNVYQTMIRFEKFGGPKQLIQNHLQVVQDRASAISADLRLSLESKSLHLSLPLDATGRGTLPLLKTAYDENAELRVNRPTGAVALVSRVTLVPRTDGIYDVAELRSGCEQVLAYLRYASRGPVGAKQCTGVQFTYAANTSGNLASFRPSNSANQPPQAIPARSGGVFWGDEGSGQRVVLFRFADWPRTGELVSPSSPLAISAIIE